MPVHTLPLNVANHGYGFKTDFAYHTQIVSDLTTWLQSLEPIFDAIEAPNALTSALSEKVTYYNLIGQRVERPQHGVFVTKGKTIIAK